jgi:hypothetical protein
MNPLNDTMKALDLRDMFIAKIKNLKVLNRTFVSPDDRKDAEYIYVKNNLQMYLKAEKESNHSLCEFLFEHPRYMLLVESN